MTRLRSYYRLALILLILAQILDGAFTYYGVTHGYREGNPIIAWLILRCGTAVAVISTKMLVILIAVVLYKMGARTEIVLLAIFYYLLSVLPWILAFCRVW